MALHWKMAMTFAIRSRYPIVGIEIDGFAAPKAIDLHVILLRWAAGTDPVSKHRTCGRS